MKILQKIKKRKKVVFYLLGIVLIYIGYCSFTSSTANYYLTIDNNTGTNFHALVYLDGEVVFDDTVVIGFAPQVVNIQSNYGFHKIEVKRKDGKKLMKISSFYSLPIWHHDEARIVKEIVFVSHFTLDIRIFIYKEGVNIENGCYKRTFI